MRQPVTSPLAFVPVSEHLIGGRHRTWERDRFRDSGELVRARDVATLLEQGIAQHQAGASGREL
jgi:hypothetical protein